MKKADRLLESLHELLKEESEIEEVINSLPVGYISVKVISGHTYTYRQWRDGSKIVSQYVPESLLNSVKRKIAIRKENEAVLKTVRKELRSVKGKVLRAGLLSEEEIQTLKEKAREEVLANK